MSKQSETETNRTMRDASHTNPYTGTTFGETAVYNRGEPVTDGGTPKQESGTIGDVDHTPRLGAPDAGRVYERGGENDAAGNGRRGSENDAAGSGRRGGENDAAGSGRRGDEGDEDAHTDET